MKTIMMLQCFMFEIHRSSINHSPQMIQESYSHSWNLVTSCSPQIIPHVEGYHSDYYRTTPHGVDAAVSLQVLCEDHLLQELVPAKALAVAPVKDVEAQETLPVPATFPCTLEQMKH
jgi:hypothetical protein